MIKQGVAFNEDIIRAVANSSDYTESQVEHTLNFIVDRIRKMAMNTEILSIKMPRIGTMYYKTGFLKATIGKVENSPHLENQEELLNKFRGRLDHINALIGHSGFSRHKSRPKLNDIVLKGFMSRKDMESNQNNKWI